MAGVGVATNHYHTLGVAPWAEDAVIRAAYVALMRTYHPDRNPAPEAHTRAREITNAFAILGDPRKRAAYDALGPLCSDEGVGAEFADRRPPRPPMRNMGLASVALAAAVSLAFVVWPKSEPSPSARLHRAAVARPVAERAAPAPAVRVAPKPPIRRASANPPVLEATALKPAPAKAPVHEAEPSRRKTRAPIAQKPRIARASARAPAALQVAAVQTAPAAPPRPVPTNPNDRRTQVERIAIGFLKQSLEHADAHKQELLLSARNRADTTRAACRSDDCVTDAYLRQIRETTAIVEGRTPKQ